MRSRTWWRYRGELLLALVLLGGLLLALALVWMLCR
jgi:hypothetical protein